MLDTRHIRLINTNRTCLFKRDQTILIPARIRKMTKLSRGDEVSVSFGEAANEIAIVPYSDKMTENKMVINRSGAVRIPSEIKRFSNLKEGDVFLVYVYEDYTGVVLKMVE